MSITEFLARALPQHEQGDLPYALEHKWTIKTHLIELTKEFPTLSLAVRSYTHDDGRTLQLLAVEGTLPMYYQDVKYNIPVALWLPERFPAAAPMPYVVPTPDMIIKPRHSFVDASGFVRAPCVVHWSARSNLVDLCHSISMDFAGNPPLFSKPPNWTPEMDMGMGARESSPPPQHSTPQPQHEFHENPMNWSVSGPSPPQQGVQPFPGRLHSPASHYGQYGAQPDHSNLAQQQQQQQQQQQPQQHSGHGTGASGGDLWGGTTSLSPAQVGGSAAPAQHAEPLPPAEDLTAVFRERAVAALSQRLHVSLSSTRPAAREQLEKLFETQQELQQRGVQLRMTAEEMAGERHALESSVIEMNTKGAQIERWLVDNESKMPTGDIDPDEAIVAADVLDAQALEVQVQDLALEDTLYVLQKAFQEGLLDTPTYLRQVRQLCSKQFMARALGLKVAARQHSLLRTRPAYGRQQPGPGTGPANGTLPLHLGDAWANTGMLANPLAG